MRASPWNRRTRLALVLSLAGAAGAAAVATLTSDPSDWQPTELVATLAGFALASELLPLRVRRPPSRETSWRITSSAPVILALVFLGPAPAVAIGWASLSVVGLVERTPLRDVAANFANYGIHLVTGALLAELLITRLELSADEPALVLVVVGLYAYVETMSFVLNASYGSLAYGESMIATGLHEWRIQLGIASPLVLIAALTAQVYGRAGLVALMALVAIQLLFLVLARELQRSYDRADRVSDLSASRGRLVAQILSAEQAERRRLAESLHDHAMQNLLAARQQVMSGLDTKNTDRVLAALDATIEQLRHEVFELHPTVFEHVGLSAAIEAVANHAARRGGFEVAVSVSAGAGTNERDLLLFSVARELLMNAGTHSGASRVAVRIFEEHGLVCLEVSDNGCGFERQQLRGALEAGHIGLASNAERIEALGGGFDIVSEPGNGTVIKATMPRESEAVPQTAASTRVSAPMPAAVEVST